MSGCKYYDPDQVFKRLKVVEFPPSFVGLSSTQCVDLDSDLNRSAYVKTMCGGKLMKFDDAREISASHRAFEIVQKDYCTLQITFHPQNESVFRSKQRQQLADDKFVFDLRVIQIDQVRCCNIELHSEIARYYISGQYEQCKITHYPKVIDFGDVDMGIRVKKTVRLRNESNSISASFTADRLTYFEITPAKFTIPPNSSIRLTISVRPVALKVGNVFSFKIRNPHEENESDVDPAKEEINYITYTINNIINVKYCPPVRKEIHVESLHKLYDRLPKYTYVNEEVDTQKKRKAITSQYLDYALKSCQARKKGKCTVFRSKDVCEPYVSSKLDKNFCKTFVAKISLFELFGIEFQPCIIDFGRVAVTSYGSSELIIKNNTKYNINVFFLNDNRIRYTDKMLKYLKINLKASNTIQIVLFCQGFVAGCYSGSISYKIDGVYNGKHPYTLDVGHPLLMIPEKSLKFGMVTTDMFITNVPVKVYNNFNVETDYKWMELNQEIPFKIFPMSGTIPSHSCKVCAIKYECKPSKSKVHEVEFISKGSSFKTIPIELSVMTRKLAIKFLQPAVNFKDVPLNLSTVEKVKLENSSREIALYQVAEPLIPGLKIEPMSGIIRPKMIMTFDIVVKMACVLEFSVDINVKINNKESVILPLSGNIIEPRLIIHPKSIYMPRVPCQMISYVPITFQNFGPVKSEVEVLETDDDNMFNVYIQVGNAKQRVYKFDVEGGQSKQVFIKVCDVFRREYDMYIPFKINDLLGPPDIHTNLIEMNRYIGEHEQCYASNTKVKLIPVNKDIPFCRINGVFTVPWIQFSTDKFDIEYKSSLVRNFMEFTMTNVSKYCLYMTIVTSKLAPHFSIKLESPEDMKTTITETSIKFELDQEMEVTFSVDFHPKSHGRFVSFAMLYLDKQMTIPYSNLTFTGKRESPAMTPSVYRVIFPPCHVGTKLTKIITLDLEDETILEMLSCEIKEDSHLTVKFIDFEVLKREEDEAYYSIITVELSLYSDSPFAGAFTVRFIHENGASCDVEAHYCVTFCFLTLHANSYVNLKDNPYPYYPLKSQTKLYNYMEECVDFLEKWMFQQGFRRDLYPVIPDTFHAISSFLASVNPHKTKGINVSYLNFVRRIAGPLMKHVRKIVVTNVDESFKIVKEIHDTYREIIILLHSRGANLWVLQAKFLLSYEQFVIYSDNVTPKCNADIVLTQELLADEELFQRLNKQSWIDLILQSYKVFIMDSCFFECVCVSNQPRNVRQILIDWYNEQIMIQHKNLLGKHHPLKLITNLTTDLSDGVAIASAMLNYCPFLKENFSMFCEISDKHREGDIVNNLSLIIEAFNLIRLYFPLSTEDLFKPNELHMLFLSVHLYVTLPMFKTKDIIKFNPPLLRSSSRQVVISPHSQETLIYSFMILNNYGGNFVVEKSSSGENGKKMFLTVRYTASFLHEESCILIVHGYNKTRIFDTYILFILRGQAGVLIPVKKLKVTGPLYRPNKVDVQLSSPFTSSDIFHLSITDVEPTMPVTFDDLNKPKFYVRRLNLIDKEIFMHGVAKDSGQTNSNTEQKVMLMLICLNTEIGNSWIWFQSSIGQFFIKVTSQPRWDIAMESLHAKVQSWPMDPCSCGEACECYRTTILKIPHHNELMMKALRYALLEHASETMMTVFDRLVDTENGKIIIGMLLKEGGTHMHELQHILRSESKYRITSRGLLPQYDSVVLRQHSNAILGLPVTIPAKDKFEKYSVTFTSDCGMDIRTYRIFFIESRTILPNKKHNLPKEVLIF